MVTVIACLIAFMYFFIGYAKTVDFDLPATLFLLVVFVIGSWLSVIVGTCLARFIGLFFPEEFPEEPNGISFIGSLERDEKTQGSFFLGIGSINQEQFYFYYEENENGGFVPKKIPVSTNVAFYQDKSEEDKQIPHQVQIFEKDFKWNWLTWLFIPSNERQYDFYIPEGSIKSEYQP